MSRCLPRLARIMRATGPSGAHRWYAGHAQRSAGYAQLTGNLRIARSALLRLPRRYATLMSAALISRLYWPGAAPGGPA
jgi:hypothetical protein